MAYLYRVKKAGYESPKWYGRWKDSAGQWRSMALSKHKATAQKMLSALSINQELETVGIGRNKITLDQLVLKFRESIASASTPDYAKLIHGRVHRTIAHLHIGRPEQINAANTQIAVAELTNSLRTRNHYAAAIKQFCRWLVDNGYSRKNPVAGLKPAKADADKRYVRRALTREEWARLSEATRGSPAQFRGLTGVDRLALYQVVMATGWRAGGLAQLRVGDFYPDGLVILQAKYSKNRKEQRKFLPPTLTKVMQKYLQDRKPQEHAWPGTWAQDAAEMLRVDLKAAGIAHKNEEGILDFHSFRNTSITWLLEAGTPIYLVQKHADHANPAQTMRYARPSRGTLDKAVEDVFSGTVGTG